MPRTFDLFSYYFLMQIKQNDLFILSSASAAQTVECFSLDNACQFSYLMPVHKIMTRHKHTECMQNIPGEVWIKQNWEIWKQPPKKKRSTVKMKTNETKTAWNTTIIKQTRMISVIQVKNQQHHMHTAKTCLSKMCKPLSHLRQI